MSISEWYASRLNSARVVFHTKAAIEHLGFNPDKACSLLLLYALHRQHSLSGDEPMVLEQLHALRRNVPGSQGAQFVHSSCTTEYMLNVLVPALMLSLY